MQALAGLLRHARKYANILQSYFWHMVEHLKYNKYCNK